MDELLDDLFGNDGDSSVMTRIGQCLATSDNQIAVGEVRLCVSMGGYGVFANCAAPAGTLIMAEVPVLDWHGCRFDDLQSLIQQVRNICESQTARVVCLEHLFPRSIDDVQQFEVDRVRELICCDINDLSLQYDISEVDLMRIVLALQHNGFGSGLYKSLTKINHSCNPNCIKYFPTKLSTQSSEVWTIRPVLEGEEITICYCDPLEMTRLAKHSFLQANHCFICDCSECANAAVVESKWTRWEQELQRMETELNWSQVDCTKHVLVTCVDIIEACELFLSGTIDISSNSSQKECDPNIMNEINASLIETCVLLDTIKLSARTHKLIVNLCAAGMEKIDNLHTTKNRVMSTAIGQLTLAQGKQHLAVKYLLHGLKLHELQIQYLGPNHPDLISTLVDMASGLDGMVQHYAPTLREAFGAAYSWATSRDLALAQLKVMRAEAQRLKMLYNTRVRYSDAGRALLQPGDVYWTKACASSTGTAAGEPSTQIQNDK